MVFDENGDNINFSSEEQAQLEVRSVFINCEPEEGNVSPDSEATRFEREELFKHSVLHDCNKKLALTVKITSEPNSSGDEYLPIEHVFEGVNKKRIRLLDPYILRLRREPPLQAYKLRRVDTISGVLIDSEGRTLRESQRNTRNRVERDLSHSSEDHGWTIEYIQHSPSYTVTPENLELQQTSALADVNSALQDSSSCVKKRSLCTNALNTTIGKRNKRNVHNILVEESTDENNPWNSKEHFYRISDSDKDKFRAENYEDSSDDDGPSRSVLSSNHNKDNSRNPEANAKTQPEDKIRHKKNFRSKFKMFMTKDSFSRLGKIKSSEKSKTNSPSTRSKEVQERSALKETNERPENESDDFSSDQTEVSEKDYAVYEIGNPELWYTVHVQLFEKLSTPDGKTVWNDLTKGEQASVSSTSPEWTGQDLTVRYRPAEWIPREEFSLPMASLCLLAPIRAANIDSFSEANATYYNSVADDGGYIVVPEEDVMGLKVDEMNIDKRDENNTDSELITKTDDRTEQARRRVVVRTSRALLGGADDKVNIAFQGTDKYLTLPHRRPHHAQIDLEARADENELVRIGASGRIAIAVADNTRKTRTIITLQVGNTGLAAARFRVATRDCGPALSDLMDDKNQAVTMAGPVLIPPRHTRSLRLELPIDIPIDVAHCSVTLLNDEDKSVAVRDVAIKKGDRCFCVWHCDCVCLSDDPKLICRHMAEARQSAAGLSPHDRTRHARSACYEDDITINIFVIITGVLIALLLLGLIKAFMGLIFRCVGTAGLDQLVQIPRKIDHYYESSLCSRKVEYDCDGYPVHPDTRERTVRYISLPMEFLLNAVFFIIVPVIVMYEAIRQLISRCKTGKTKNVCVMSTKSDTKKCFSSQDMQGLAMRWRRRRGGLRRWMTPEAQELSKDLWKEGLAPVQTDMRPLLREPRHEAVATETRENESCVDSEQDDTDYVLTQMQKSRESLSALRHG